jgi:hypothetical protein
MCAVQFEIRLSVVIEQPQVPGHRVVAPGAVRPKLPRPPGCGTRRSPSQTCHRVVLRCPRGNCCSPVPR